MGRKRFEVLREIFRDYDTKREGLISRGAFRKQVENLMPSLTMHCDSMFDSVEQGDGAGIPLSAFVHLCEPSTTIAQAEALANKYGGSLYKEDAEKRRIQNKQRAKARKEQAAHAAEQEALEVDLGVAFDKWCTEGNSTVSFNTLRHHCPELDPYVVGVWFHQNDKDLNGRLDKSEFISMLRGHYGGAAEEHLQHLSQHLHHTTYSHMQNPAHAA